MSTRSIFGSAFAAGGAAGLLCTHASASTVFPLLDRYSTVPWPIHVTETPRSFFMPSLQPSAGGRARHSAGTKLRQVLGPVQHRRSVAQGERLLDGGPERQVL